MNVCKEKGALCMFAQASGYCSLTVCLGRIEKRPTIKSKRERKKGLPYQKTVPKMPPCKEPKQGRWIYTEYENGNAKMCCSECGEGVYNKTRYCPNCGVKMEK